MVPLVKRTLMTAGVESETDSGKEIVKWGDLGSQATRDTSQYLIHVDGVGRWA